MKKRDSLVRCLCRAFCCLSISISLPISTVFAHHPVSAKFDETRPLSLTGVVTAVDWANPHVHVFVNVTDSNGATVNWAIELESPVLLEWSGWQPDALEPGDTITAEGPAARDDSRQLWGELISIGGERVFDVDDDVFSGRLANRPQGETPRWPDGQPRLGPPPGESGYWALPGASALVEEGVEVTMDAHGVLANIDDAASVAPFQTWAKDLYVLRQRNHLKDDPMFRLCIPPAGPRQFQLPWGIQLVEQRDRERIIALLGGGNGNWRLIHTDGRDQVGQLAGNDDNPLFYGRAVAEWQGDTLVIDTTGFKEAFWFSNGGLPHTSLLHLVERLSRPDLNTLHYEVTIDDPGAYTRTWTSSWDLQWIAGEDLPEYYCQDNRP